MTRDELDQLFHPVTDAVVKLVAQERLDEADATFLLTVFIDHLQGAGWDAADEAYEFRKISFVQDAFRFLGVELS